MQIGSRYSYDIGTMLYPPHNDVRSDAASKKENTSLSTEKDTKENKTRNELSPQEQKMLTELKTRDAEVRQHEAAHKAGGAPTGAASYTYQKGPDGQMYAIGGEVSVSMKSGSTPEETIANAQAVIASAMAPANPSPQDHAVASSARVMMMKAEQEKAKERYEEAMGLNAYKNEAEQKDAESKIDLQA